MMDGWGQNQNRGVGALPAGSAFQVLALWVCSSYLSGCSALVALLETPKDGARRGWPC